MTLDFNGKEINRLFDDLVKTSGLKNPRNDYDKIVAKVTEEFSGGNEKLKARNKDKDEIKVKIEQLNRDIKKNHNIRNHRMRRANKKRADKRASLKAQINELEQKLKDLNLEDSSQS